MVFLWHQCFILYLYWVCAAYKCMGPFPLLGSGSSSTFYRLFFYQSGAVGRSQRTTCFQVRHVCYVQGLNSNKDLKFQYIPAYDRMDGTEFPGHF